MTRIVIGVEEDRENTGKMADNRLLLQTFATHLVKDSKYVVKMNYRQCCFCGCFRESPEVIGWLSPFLCFFVCLDFLVFFFFLSFRHMGDKVASALLSAILPLGSKLLPQNTEELASVGSKFTDLMSTVGVLAGAGDGEGHLHLCKAVIQWLDVW